MILAGAVVAVVLTIALGVRVDPAGTALIECVIASLLLLSRLWWRKAGHERFADTCGVIGLVALGGMAAGPSQCWN